MAKKRKKVNKATLSKQEKLKKIKWYNLTNILSHQAPFMFITSGRGIGKTTAAALWAYKDYLASDGQNQFIITRRNTDEKKWVKTLFNKALDIEGNKHQVKLKGDIFYIRDKPEFEDLYKENEEGKMVQSNDTDDWRIFGFFVALTEQQDARGGNFHDVNKIIFDEFILENQRQQYLTDEVNALMQLWSTVDRNENRVRVVCMSNSGAITNPYFAEYKINSADLLKHGFIKRKDGFVVFEYVDPEPYKALWEDSWLTKVAPDSWLNMAQDNKFQDINYVNVEEKPRDAKPVMVIHYANLAWTLYRKDSVGKLWVADGALDLPPEKHFNANWSSPNADMLYMTKNMRKFFKENILNNNVIYKTPEAKNGFFDLIMNAKL